MIRALGRRIISAGFTAAPTTIASATTRRRNRFVNVPLVSHDGTPALFYDDLLRGKSVLVNFMYTRCTDRCPMTAHNLAEVQRLLASRVGSDLFIYSISVDPQHDTPAVLRAYARNAGAGPGWLFLSGSSQDIGRIRANFGDDPGVGFSQSDHLNLIAYGNEPLERWAGFPAWTDARTMVQYLSWIQPGGPVPSLDAPSRY
jgi:protein SCO1/2